MRYYLWMVGVALLAWTSSAQAQYATPFVSAMRTKNPAATSTPVGFTSFFGQSMLTSRPNNAAMFGSRPTLPSAFSLTNLFPSFSGLVQNTLLPRTPTTQK